MKEEIPGTENLTELLRRLSPEKRALLARRLSEKKAAAEKKSRLARGAESEFYPLSFAQQRLWFLDELEPDTSLYNIPVAVRLRGRLNPAALEESLNEIVRRHHVLRARFAAIDGKPVQIIEPAQRIHLQIRQVEKLSADDERDAIRRLVAADAWKPFDLKRDPLVRATLIRLGRQDHVLIFCLHHIVSDGWSIGVLMEEVAVLYHAFSNHHPSPLEELPVQYTDFAVWQSEWLNGDLLEQELTYWKRQLAGAAPVLELPADRPRPPVPSYSGALQSLRLSRRLLQDLETLARQQGVTLFMLLLAAFKVLLFRYTRQPEIIVGTAVAGRTQKEVAGLIGLFVNTLVLRTGLSSDASFLQVLERVRDISLRAFAHQSVPFEKLVDELQPVRNLNYTPVFQVMFVLQDTPRSALSLTDLTLTQIGTPAPTAKFDLTLTMERDEQGLIAAISYKTALFDAATIIRMLGHLQVLFEGVVHNPESRVSELPLLTKAEWQQTVEQENNEVLDVSLDQCIHELIAQQAARSPEATAVVYEGAQLTYDQLNKRANQLGHYLQALGIGPEVRVGICLEPSLETMVGLLGILKAGGAYVGLDPSLPKQRLAFMLEDAGVPVLLSQRRLVPGLPQSSAKVVCLDSDWSAIAQQSEENPISGVTAINLSNVIYTSGSTGMPKAVGGAHEQLLHYLHAILDRLNLTAGSSFAMHQNLAVDAPVTFMYGALLKGGALHLISPDRASDPQRFGEYFQQNQIDYFKTAPSHMAVLQTAAHPPDVMPRRLLLLGGEASRNELIEDLRLLAPDCTIVNHYGPTETTVGVLTYEVPKEGITHRCSSLPLGQPLANTTAYLLDRDLNPVPIGVPGELHIGGSNVARGYINRPELTAEKFIPDPFGKKRGARLYRTGDVARYLADGAIEFLGRQDQQVKIRGFRIELEEVEAVLAEHPAVRSGVVLVSENGEQDKHLVAYILAQHGVALTTKELRRHLQEKLPDYMVPKHFMLIDELPRTPQGKVDRRALLVSAASPLEAASDHIGPGSGEEELLLTLCRELLGREQLTVADNFFAAGGHSLLATQLTARIRRSFGVEVPLRAVFETATLGGLARRVKEARAEHRGLQLPPLRARARSADEAGLRLSFAQQRLWFLEQLTPGGSAYNVATVVRLRGRLDVRALERSINEIVARHEVLRTTFKLVAGEPVQVVQAELRITLPVVSLDSERGREQWRELAAAAGREPLDLEQGPLLRAQLLELSAEEHILLLTLHHIISDGWSLTILARELARLYEGYERGEERVLEPLALQYGDYAEWQRGWLQGAELAQQLGYWEQQLAALPAPRLPQDKLRPAVESYRGASYVVVLEAELSRQLRQRSVAESVTLFMLLLGAFEVLLWRYNGAGEVVVGTPIANRQEVGLEELIGFFVNTLVLRVAVRGEERFGELLQRVREVTLEAYAHQDVPFERVVEELQPERDLSRNPLFQVLFALQNVPQYVIQLRDLSLEGVELNAATTRFDLELHIWDRPEGLNCTWVYSTDLFERETIARMATHYQVLLQQLIAAPELPLARLQYLSAAEQAQVLYEWNRTERRYEAVACVQHLFEAQAARTPRQVAVQDEEQRLSYAELNERANQWAHYLRGLGIGPEVVVGIMLERGVELVAALLGVLKAGGAYVPLERNYPETRLRQMLRDAQAPLVLTDQEMGAAGAGVKQLRVDREWAAVAGCERRRAPASEVSGGNLAYVIYTSGSTGRPKGVAIEHQSAVNFLQWAVEEFGSETLGVVLAGTSICFDLSVFEMFAPLSCGGQVVLAENVLHLSSHAAAWAVRLINTVPSAMAGLVQLQAVPGGVRVVNLAGEALGQSLVAAVYEAGVAAVYNLYGPTEYTTYTTGGLAPRGSEREPSIGRPIANTEVYILDGAGEPVAVGVAGELYLGGAGLARGYLGQAAQTAEKFVPHRFSAVGGRRLYRTGDVARYRADGEIEYLGRVDQQVKLRGYRIELGEVEAVLRQHPAVRESVVALRAEGGGDKRLVAYVVPHPFSGEADTFSNSRPNHAHAAEDQSLAEHGSRWELVWNETYSQSSSALHDPHFNIVGWTSSYTGLPIPPEQMHEWLDQIVERILAPRPARVLEIGAGTGLLLFRIAPYCTDYYATDFSTVALQYLKEQIAQLDLPQVRLLHRRAEDFTGLESGAFDAVVLNSVVQYFPGLSYLMLVLESCVKAVRPGGTIFLGDIRSFPLLEAFHAAVLLQQAAPSLSRAQFRQQVKKRVSDEQELLIAPAFFYSLPSHHPEIGDVEIKLKRGRFRNELTEFRYDVILHVGPKASQESASEALILDWKQEQLTLEKLRRRLVESKPDAVYLAHVPNARLTDANRTLEWLASEDADTIGEWRSLQRETSGEGVEPEDVWDLSRDLPYTVDITYGPEVTTDGSFDVILRRVTNALDNPVVVRNETYVHRQTEKPSHYANDPLRATFQRNLIRQLRSFVGERLPEYMTPSAIVMLDAMPLTPNGKIDRRALPAPGQARPELEQGFVAPRTQMETLLASIWRQVLLVDRVGVFDNFFQLGGDSILSIQIIARAQEKGIKLTPRQLFQNQTVAELALVATRVQGEAELVEQTEEKSNEFAWEAADLDELTSLIRQSKGTAREALNHDRIEDFYPLSSTQEGILFHTLRDARSNLYLHQFTAVLEGDLDVGSFIRAWQKIVERHSILRTSFLWEGLNRPIQIVERTVELPVQIEDWQKLSAADRKARLAAFLEADNQRRFSLVEAPLMRLALIRLEDQQYHFVWSHHHLLLDGWSLNLVFKELLVCYEAYRHGEEPELPQPHSYRDYIAWLQRHDRSQSEKFWRQRLSGFTRPTRLPAKMSADSAAETGDRYGDDQFQLSQSITAALRAVAQQHRLTLGTITQGVWALLLSRYTGDDDVVFGSVVSGRPAQLPGVESMIGLFINTLPVRMRIDGEEWLLSWLHKLQEQEVEMREQQHCPLVEVHGWSDVPRTDPLFETIVSVDNYPVDVFAEQVKVELRVREVQGRQRSNYPLAVVVVPGVELAVRINWDRRRYHSEMITHILGNYARLLGRVATRPHVTLNALKLIREEERKLIRLPTKVAALDESFNFQIGPGN